MTITRLSFVDTRNSPISGRIGNPRTDVGVGAPDGGDVVKMGNAGPEGVGAPDGGDIGGDRGAVGGPDPHDASLG